LFDFPLNGEASDPIFRREGRRKKTLRLRSETGKKKEEECLKLKASY